MATFYRELPTTWGQPMIDRVITDDEVRDYLTAFRRDHRLRWYLYCSVLGFNPLGNLMRWRNVAEHLHY